MLFILKLILKLFVLPIMLILAIVVGVLKILVYLSSTVLALIAGVMAVVGFLLIFKGQFVGAILYLVIAYLISPYGIPTIAMWLVAQIQFAKESMGAFLMS